VLAACETDGGLHHEQERGAGDEAQIQRAKYVPMVNWPGNLKQPARASIYL